MHDAYDDSYFDPLPRRRPIPWVTLLLVGTTVAVFLLQLYAVRRYGDDVIGDMLGCSREALADGRYWTLVTYAWVHGVVIFGQPDLFWLHIAANMIPVICLGPAIEDFIGAGRYLGLYIGGAIASALFWLWITPDAVEGIVGASGAVFALIAAAGTLAPRASVTVFILFILPVRMNLATMAVVICGLEAVQMVFHIMPEIAHSAHLGGAAFGFLYALAIRLTSHRHAFVN